MPQVSPETIGRLGRAQDQLFTAEAYAEDGAPSSALRLVRGALAELREAEKDLHALTERMQEVLSEC